MAAALTTTMSSIALESAREVNETCMELLHFEIVSWALSGATTPEDRESALKVIEELGHAVGLRLVERYV